MQSPEHKETESWCPDRRVILHNSEYKMILKTGDWPNQLPFRIIVHSALTHLVSLQYIKMTKLQSHSVSIGEFSVHDIPNFETPLVRGFVPYSYLDSVTSRRLKDFVMCLELALSGAILNFPRTSILVWLVYFPVRLRDLARKVARDLNFCLLRRFSCVWNMYQLMDRRFPGGLCHLVYCVDLDYSSSLIRITHNRMKHFLTWTHQAVSFNGCIDEDEQVCKYVYGLYRGLLQR